MVIETKYDINASVHLLLGSGGSFNIISATVIGAQISVSAPLGRVSTVYLVRLPDNSTRQSSELRLFDTVERAQEILDIINAT